MIRIEKITDSPEDRLFPDIIYLNGEEINRIKGGETASLELEPGKHRISVASTLLKSIFKSKPVEINYTGEAIYLQTYSNNLGIPQVVQVEANVGNDDSKVSTSPSERGSSTKYRKRGTADHSALNNSEKETLATTPKSKELKDSDGWNTNWAWSLLLLPLFLLFLNMDIVENKESSSPASKATPETDGGSGTEETRTTTLGVVRFALKCQRRNQTAYKIVAMDQARADGIIVHYGGSGADVGRSGVNPNFSHVDVSIDTHDMRYDFETYFPPNREYTYLVFDGPFYLRRSDSKFVDETSKEDWGVTDVYDCHKIDGDRADKAIRDFWSAHGELERRKQREEQSQLESREL